MTENFPKLVIGNKLQVRKLRECQAELIKQNLYRDISYSNAEN